MPSPPNPNQEATVVREEIRTSHVERCGYLQVPPAKKHKTNHGKDGCFSCFFSPTESCLYHMSPAAWGGQYFHCNNLDQLIHLSFRLKTSEYSFGTVSLSRGYVFFADRISYSPSNSRVLGPTLWLTVMDTSGNEHCSGCFGDAWLHGSAWKPLIDLRVHLHMPGSGMPRIWRLYRPYDIYITSPNTSEGKIHPPTTAS